MKNKPCQAYSLEGKILVFIMRIIARIVRFFYGKAFDTPLKNYREDALFFKFPSKDLFYFLYKYYLNPPIVDDTNGKTEEYFKNQNFNISTPENFYTISEIKMTAAGDLMPYEWIKSEYCSELWDDIGDDFFASDIVFANLETPINTSKPASYVPEMMLNDMYFNGSEDMFSIFDGNNKYKGFDILSTANNHSLDMGEEGIHSTINFLEQKNRSFIGTSRTEEEQNNFPIIEKNGIKIAFLAYTYSMNKELNPTEKPFLCNHIELNKPDVDLFLIKNHVEIAKKRGADMVVTSLHYGNAYQMYPSQHIIKNTHRVFDECGVDIILGGHAHNVQPMENYEFICPFNNEKKNGFAIYALGDFVAYDIFTWGHLPVYLKINIQKGILEGKNLTIINEITVKPVYVCGEYFSRKNKKLRFFDAERLLENMETSNISSKSKAEFVHLMNFYQTGFKNKKNNEHRIDNQLLLN